MLASAFASALLIYLVEQRNKKFPKSPFFWFDLTTFSPPVGRTENAKLLVIKRRENPKNYVLKDLSVDNFQEMYLRDFLLRRTNLVINVSMLIGWIGFSKFFASKFIVASLIIPLNVTY